MSSDAGLSIVLRALDYAARRHTRQRRKGGEKAPYINHPIRVAYYLGTLAGIDDPHILAAAVLHDTVEDTEATIEELRNEFGAEVAKIVAEVTDDKSLEKHTRKELQVEHAPGASWAAAQLKIADKLCNVEDIATAPPPGWSLDRLTEYLAWSERVVTRLPDPHPALMEAYRRALAEAREGLEADASGGSR
jgi:GTP diphosphokinase / guanosine-3',5'-bis(diphosphate) 3'-diphosphatase